MSLGQVGNAPLNAIMFAAYGHATRFINDDTNGMQVISAVPYGAICVAGAWAGLLQCVVVTPTELVKCKLQVQGATSGPTRQYSGPLDCFRKVGHRAPPPADCGICAVAHQQRVRLRALHCCSCCAAAPLQPVMHGHR